MNLYRSCRVGPRKCSKNPLKEHFGVSGNEHGWANSECDREKCVQNKPPSVPRAEKISIFWRVCDVSMSWRLLSFFLHLLRKRPIFPNATVEARVTLCAYSDATLNYTREPGPFLKGDFQLCSLAEFFALCVSISASQWATVASCIAGSSHFKNGALHRCGRWHLSRAGATCGLIRKFWCVENLPGTCSGCCFASRLPLVVGKIGSPKFETHSKESERMCVCVWRWTHAYEFLGKIISLRWWKLTLKKWLSLFFTAFHQSGTAGFGGVTGRIRGMSLF